MASSYGRLAALRPANTNEAELYAIPASTEIVGVLEICNQDTVARDISIALTDGAGAAAGEDWILYEFELAGNATLTQSPITAKTGEYIRVQASVADKISFVLHGLKIT